MKSRSLLAGLVLTVLILLPAFSPLSADENATVTDENVNHKASIEKWRHTRHGRLMKSDGWLTLVGLEWLREGSSTVGSAEDNDIQLPGGPDHWGTVTLQGEELSFSSLDTNHIFIDGKPLAQVEMIVDTEGEPTVISSGNLQIHAIFRESYGLRIKDSKAPALQNFKGVDNFPIDESWYFNERFILAEEGTTIEVANVLGQIIDFPVYGSFEFVRDGKTYSLIGLGSEDSEDLWFIFTDRTNGRGTYGAGRFLYSDGMPENGYLKLDFNKSYNPPCAFNEWSTCPLPPQRNRMDSWVEAGEKDFHPDAD